MRRWWVIGIALAAAGAAALYLIPEPVPFDFLRGHRPVESSTMQHYGGRAGTPQTQVVKYVLKSDFDRKLKEAVPELRQYGFAPAPVETDLDVVYMLEDGRKPERGEVVMFKRDFEKGSMTVVVMGQVERSWFDRFRDWLGM
jgi:hypothetical protein